MANILFLKLVLIGLGLLQSTNAQTMSCTVNPTSAVCENVSSSFLTNIRSENITVIKIVNSSLTSLSEEDFSKFTNVSEITVDKCSVPGRVLKFMLSLTELKQLRITNSNLSEKDIPVLRDARNLVKLSFEGNKLTRVKNEVFNSLFHLQEMNLSFNEISEIDTTAFDDLPALRKLDLSHNRIVDGLGFIFGKGFSNSFTHLEELDLSHNAISEVESGALDGLPFLRVLDLSYNRLGEGGGIKTGVFADLPHVEEIDLSHNAISEVESGALNGLPPLRLLDLSHNALGRGFSRGVLTLPRGCAWCADAGACPAAHACPPPAAVDALWRALARTRALRLRGNPVCQAVDSAPAPQEQCADVVLQGEEGCRERQAGGCARHACRDAFLQAACEEHGQCETSQTSVACEGLSGNFIPAGNTVHVHVMYIIESDMSSLSARDFDAFQNLEVMHIDSCILSVSAGSIFAPLKRLRTLEIIGSNVSEEVFSLVESANSLVKLSLEGNRLTHVNKSFFDNLSRLEEIDLSRNEISTIEVYAFRGLSALWRLNLSQNQLPDDFDMSSLSLPDGCDLRSLVATCPESAADDSRRGRRRGGLDEGGRRREDGGRRGGEWDGGAGTEGEKFPRSNASDSGLTDDGSTGHHAPVVQETWRNVLKHIALVVLVLLLCRVLVLLPLLFWKKFKPQSSLHGSMDNDGGEGGSLNEHGDGPLGRTGWRPEDWEESSQQTLLPRDALNPHLDTKPSGAVSRGLHRGRFLAGFRRRTKHGPSSSLKRAKKNYLEKQILSQEQLINDVERRLTRHITDLKYMIMAQFLFQQSRQCVLPRSRSFCLLISTSPGCLFIAMLTDHQVVVANDEDDLAYMMRTLIEEYSKWGLNINMMKTLYLPIGKDGVDLQISSSLVVKKCSQFTYLGSIINQEGSCEDDIRHRINLGKASIQVLNALLWSSKFRWQTKMKIYKTIIEPITTYGAESWSITERNRKKIEAVEMDFLRRSLKVSRLEHIKNEEIRERSAKKETILHHIEQKQLLWYGHINRMEEERIPKNVFLYQPDRRRKRGRPRTTWIQGIESAMTRRHLKQEDTQDRKLWRLKCGMRQKP